MKVRMILPLALVLCGGTALAVLPGASLGVNRTDTKHVVGDYVEARTASVFAGACHYNGELVTTGQDAILAWSIRGGAWKGIDLTGVRAMGSVTSDANLGETGHRRCELVVDAGSAEQVSAFADMVRENSGAEVGTLANVRRGPVNFELAAGGRYTVSSNAFAAMTVDAMPDAGCCKQPNLVWYSPLVKLENRKVGLTQSAEYTAGTLGECWQRAAENDAFYGTFTF